MGIDPKLLERPTDAEVASIELMAARLEKLIPAHLKQRETYAGALLMLAVEAARKAGISDAELAEAINALLAVNASKGDDG